MAQGGGRSLQEVRSDLSSISRSVSEGNLKGQKSSPIYRGGGGSTGGGMKKGGKKKGNY
jgi:hypothetical protein